MAEAFSGCLRDIIFKIDFPYSWYYKMFKDSPRLRFVRVTYESEGCTFKLPSWIRAYCRFLVADDLHDDIQLLAEREWSLLELSKV